jgi:hypothetical protein
MGPLGAITGLLLACSAIKSGSDWIEIAPWCPRVQARSDVCEEAAQKQAAAAASAGRAASLAAWLCVRQGKEGLVAACLADA